MNILFVNDIPFNPIGGGIERVTDILTKELIKRGHTIYYLCGKLSQSKLYLLNYTFPVKLFQLPDYGFFDNEENVIFYKNLQIELKLDVVVNQRGLGGYFNSLLPITDTKIVSVIHSTPESVIIELLNKLVELTSPPFVGFKKMIKKNFPGLITLYWKKKFTKEMEVKYDELSYYSNVIVTLSERYIDILKNFINNPHLSNIITIPNPTTFNVTETSFEPKKKIILYVGRLVNGEKEPLRILKIWNYLHLEYPDWQLKIVGEGEEKGKMQKYVKSHGLNNVFFEGRQSCVDKYYRDASFICLTSNYEGFPMVITEGMQYGCVPFTFKSYGAAFDVVDDNYNGCLISAFDLREYASRLSELMKNENKRIEMSKAAIAKVEMFSVKKIVDRWENLFYSL